MVLFFGLVRRYKERKRLAKIKQASITRLVKKQITFINDKIERNWLEDMNRSNKEADTKNLKCPRCLSSNVHDKMGDKTSEIKGELSGQSSSLLGFGGGEVAGIIQGTSEIMPYNLCKQCGHEWKKISIDHKYFNALMDSRFTMLAGYVSNYYDLVNISYDPTDLSEVYDTLDEKLRVYNERLNEPHRIATIKDFFGKGILIETIRHFYDKVYGIGCGTWHDQNFQLNQCKDHLVNEFGFVDETKM